MNTSVILASLSWDMAAIYLTLSCEAAGRVVGQWKERVKEELERKLAHWEGIPSNAHQCVCFIFHALAKLPMEVQHEPELCCLSHRIASTAFQSTEAEYYFLWYLGYSWLYTNMSGHTKHQTDGELNLSCIISWHPFSCLEGMLANICLHTHIYAEARRWVIVKLPGLWC